jgi:7-carboxy-7-deazaguanine synthase
VVVADDELIISEVFGPTWQGEGPTTGHRAGFVRLGRCNLNCRWCDTPYSWDWSRFDPAVELHRRSPTDLLGELDAMAVDLMVVTGGEPLLQQGRLPPLLAGARQRGWRVEIETAGTLLPELAPELVDAYNVSPKLAHSGVALERRYRPDVLRTFAATDKAAFKFVACQPSDLDEIATMVDDCGLSNVWVMPEGTDAATVLERLQALAPAVLERGWHLSGRLHVLIWGDRRGV